MLHHKTTAADITARDNIEVFLDLRWETVAEMCNCGCQTIKEPVHLWTDIDGHNGLVITSGIKLIFHGICSSCWCINNICLGCLLFTSNFSIHCN